jgi:Asp-tRNA(Asn)/Glu-tRNA(Gln) amidotransferase C subunit
MLTLQDVKQLTKFAKIKFNDDIIVQDLNKILEIISLIKDIDTDTVEPLVSLTPPTNYSKNLKK